MKRAAKRKKSRFSNSDGIRRTRQAIDAIESVFRSTHKREMTSEERRKFRLPPLDEKESTSDSA
jgi:hypothetical protein